MFLRLAGWGRPTICPAPVGTSAIEETQQVNGLREARMKRRHKRELTTKQLRARHRCYRQQTESRGREPVSFEGFEDDYADHVLDAVEDIPEDTLERSRK